MEMRFIPTYLPNSFEPSDGMRLCVAGTGYTRERASENACRRAMASLLIADPSRVVLRPTHWNISPDDLVGGLPHA